jgi:hypothetical protein
MTSKITIEVPPNDYAVRVGIEHDNLADLEIKHVGPGETWSTYIHPGTRIIEISEVKIGEIKIGNDPHGQARRAGAGQVRSTAPDVVIAADPCVPKATPTHDRRITSRR